MGEVRLRARLGTDWAVGTGTGVPGGVDRAVARDPDGLPWVPRRTVRGVTRDAVEQVAWALDEPADGPWSGFAATLFGPRLTGAAAPASPVPPGRSLVRFEPLRLSTGLRSALRGDEGAALRRQLVAERPAVAIEDDSGTASHRQLRFLEVARAGLELSGPVELAGHLDDESREAALALLAFGCRLLDKLGADRNRGIGRCVVTLEGSDVPDLAAARERLRQPPPSMWTGRPRHGNDRPPATGSRRVVTLGLDVRTPLVAPADVQGNVIRSLDHVPGRLLLPVVSEVLDRAGVDVRHALRTGALVVGPAYPSPDGQVAIPAPTCLATEADLETDGDKGEKTAANAAHPEFVAPADSEGSLAGTYVAASDGGWAAVRSLKVVETHNVIDPFAGRPDDEAGGVYSYEALAEGSRLAASVEMDEGLLAHLATASPGWREELAGTRHLGSARQAGFGEVDLTVGEPREVPSHARDVPADGTVTVLAVTPVALGSDAASEPPSTGAWVEALRAALVGAGAPASLRPSLDAAPLEPAGADGAWERGVVSRAAWVAAARFDCWHGPSGLPRPTVTAIAAGSVLRLRCSETVPADALAAVERGGVGRLTGEGFGQVRFDHPALADPILPLRFVEHDEHDDAIPEPAADSSAAKALPDGERALLDDLARAAREAALTRTALEVARDAGWRLRTLGWDDRSPGRSQFGGLREALATGGRGDVEAWRDRQLKVRQAEQDANKNPREGQWREDQLEALTALLDGPAAACPEAARPVDVDDLEERFALLLLSAAVSAHARGRERRGAER